MPDPRDRRFAAVSLKIFDVGRHAGYPEGEILFLPSPFLSPLPELLHGMVRTDIVDIFIANFGQMFSLLLLQAHPFHFTLNMAPFSSQGG